MSTGYTHKVADGTITELSAFAFACARAFGFLYCMRDDPEDAPIPDEFTPDSYHFDKAKEAESDLSGLLALTPEELQQKYTKSETDRLRYFRESLDKAMIVNRRYRDMKEKVRSWTPPTLEHERLKKFMLEQLDLSSDGDGHVAEFKAIEYIDWLNMEIKSLRQNVEYHRKEYENEKDRVASRNAWVQALKKSLI